jgi:hypothetical protein
MQAWIVIDLIAALHLYDPRDGWQDLSTEFVAGEIPSALLLDEGLCNWSDRIAGTINWGTLSAKG